MQELRVRFFGLIGAAIVSAAVAGASTVSPTTRPVITITRQWIPAGFHAIRDVAYVAHADRSQALDLYVPDVRSSPRPLMVWIHGGGWDTGDKAMPPGMGLLLRGYVVASINYRLTRQAVFPAQIFDCKAAIRFLRANAREYGIDPGHIGVWGDSAGGQLAALLGTTAGLKEYEGAEGNQFVSSDVQAVCDWYGPSDFLQTKDILGPGAGYVSRLFGGIVADHPDAARFASPAEQIGRAPLVPFFIMHGDQDLLVPVHQSQILFEKLQRAGAAVRFVIIPHSGHGTGWFKSREDLTMVYDFFDRCFRQRTPRANLATTRPSI